ncbi:MAG: TonB-dependent receptor [Balneola sp.]|nr:MAG: TonB-dependent receptor [Balneola sp.]
MRSSMLKKLLTLLVCAFSLSAGIYAQGSIYGTVTDTDGEIVAGANVVIVDLNRGNATDPDGNYRIDNVPAGSYTISATFIGYTTFTQLVQVQSGQDLELNIVLEFGAVGLDELVVSGYAVTPKRELTGSISSIAAADIENVSLQNAQSILQGRAAGVTISTTSGNPGGAFNVQIRGVNSINANSQPLYIIDGVQIELSNTSGVTSTTPLNALNPSDIESIEVLKDAAASAIYGAQAAAGVVIITTKRGKKGTSQINASYERGVRSLARNVDYVSSDDYLQYMGEALALNSGVSLDQDISSFVQTYYDFFEGYYFTSEAPGFDADNPALVNTDWQDFIFSDGVTEKYNMSVSGGTESTSYYLSGGFESTEGTAFDSDFTRLNLRTNIDHRINSKLSTSVTANISRSTQFGVCQDGNFVNCPVSQAMFTPPMSFPFFADGSYNPAGGLFRRIDWNPAVIRDEVDRNATFNQIIADASLTYLVTDWLNVRGSLSVDYRNTQDEQIRTAVSAPVQGGWISYDNRNVENVQARLVANGRYTFDRVHNVSGLVGTEYKNVYSETYATRGDGISSSFFNVLNATSTPVEASGSNTEYVVSSYFTNLKYNFDEKYFISFTGRYDGHSRFGEDVRWAFFPSVSGAWNIAEEDFFTVDVIDDLKLRVGYGQTGNSAIGNFESQALYSLAGTYSGSTGISPSQLANANLTWEEANEINVGLDYALLDNRISGSIDVYRKDNEGLLFNRPLSGDSGFTGIRENIGALRNEGIEFEINSVNVDNNDFVWSSRFNIAFQSNEILELPDDTDISPDDIFASRIIGETLGLIQVVRWAGVNPADGRPMWYDANGNITYTPEASDRVKYKDGVADAVGGFGNTLSYKGITLDAFFQFSFGQWAFPQTDYYFTRTPDFLMNLAEEVNDRWTTPGDVTYYPRAIEGGTDYPETDNYRTQLSTQSIYNTSYIRLKNVSLSYNLPSTMLDGLGIRSVKLYASAVNLLTWTAWPWYDPEVAATTTDVNGNVTAASYPTERQVYGGIDIGF